MAIQNDSTLLCKGDLKAYHESIAPYLGGNLMLGTNVSDYYSTDEKIVGVWTNGKPIYKRTFTVEVPSGTSKTDFTQVNLSTTSNPEVIVDSNITIDYFTNNSSTPHWKDDTPQEDEAFIFINPNLIGLNYRVQSQLHINIYATAYYTKTTDAANSAVITPGCYDINRPDLWPTNKEIFFGNGLYGQRITGTESLTANVRKDIRINNEECQLKAFGGWVKPDGGTWLINFPYYWNNENYISTAQIYSNIATSPYVGLMLFFKSNQTQTTIYDIWVTYTK